MTQYKHPYRTAFLTGFMMYAIAVIPFLIYHDGIFFYYGDYNVQQVPFYILAHRAVREGRFFFSPYVDLGGSMAGSFAFYLWGSPFFWLTIPFPESWLPYMMPVLMCLKYGTATLTSYIWLRGFTKTDRAAFIGALLYAFSGFTACNIVFQHFHDVVAFFPLYLIAFDRFVQRRKRVGFVLMTAFMLILNYYFFVGEAVFFVFYYILRYGWSRAYSNRIAMPPESTEEASGRAATPAGDGKKSGRRVERKQYAGALRILSEVGGLLLFGILGVGIAAFFIVQALDGVVGNSRVDNWINGYGMLYYSEPSTPLAIIKSLLVAPDLISKGTLFTNDSIKCASVSAYLPCFGIGGAVAYFDMRRYKKDWKKRVLLFFALCAFLPVLNSMFSAFNRAYYARWFYQPVLIMALMTAISLEEAEKESWKKGFIAATAGAALIAACGLIPKLSNGEWQFFTMIDNQKLFWVEIIVTAATIPAFAYIVFRKKGKERATREVVLLTAASCLVVTMGVLLNGNSLIARTGGVKWRQEMLDNKPQLPDTETFSRVETDGTSTNYEMVWGYPTIHCFESTVTPSIIEFYEAIGITRSVESELPYTRIGARQILSMRYAIENAIISSDGKYSDEGGLPGYVQILAEGDEGSNGYNVYENQYFIPMGFTFDSYVTESEYSAQDVKSATMDRLLVKDLILPDEIAENLTLSSLTHDDAENAELLSIEEAEEESSARAATACTSFAFDNGGFTATTSDLPSDNYVFFSVPYMNGFTAYVDGVKTEIVKADYGFMAVEVPAGVHEISFRYETKGLRICCLVSALSILLTAAYAFCERRRSR